MPRNIVTAHKRARDFHKNDVLTKTKQRKYTVFFFFFLYGTENIKKLFSQDLRSEAKLPGTFF